jgi:hypothetical protein
MRPQRAPVITIHTVMHAPDGPSGSGFTRSRYRAAAVARTATAERMEAMIVGDRAQGARVTILAGRAYSAVLTEVWADARNLLEGAGGRGRQMRRLAEIRRGTLGAT